MQDKNSQNKREEIIPKLIKAGELTNEEVVEIRKLFYKTAKEKPDSFYKTLGEKKTDIISYEQSFITHLLFSAEHLKKYQEAATLGKQKGIFLRIELDAQTILVNLEWLKTHLKSKSITNDGASIINYLKHWDVFFFQLKANLYNHYSYVLTENPYYDQIEETLNQLKQEYSPEKLKLLADLKGPEAPTETKGVFKIRKNGKIELIRILNAMWELKLITNADGTYPLKKDFMKEAGIFFGENLNNYEVNLSTAFQGTLESNTQIFSQMANVITDKYTESLKKKR